MLRARRAEHRLAMEEEEDSRNWGHIPREFPGEISWYDRRCRVCRQYEGPFVDTRVLRDYYARHCGEMREIERQAFWNMLERLGEFDTPDYR